MIVEIGVLLLVILAVIVVYYILKTVKHLIVNAVLGLVLIALGNMFLFNGEIKYDIVVILICAIGGIPGAAIVMLLHYLGYAF